VEISNALKMFPQFTRGRHAMNIFDHYRQRYEAAKDEEFTLQEFLTICRQDRSAYANAAERH
jgi:serine protein kinase